MNSLQHSLQQLLRQPLQRFLQHSLQPGVSRLTAPVSPVHSMGSSSALRGDHHPWARFGAIALGIWILLGSVLGFPLGLETKSVQAQPMETHLRADTERAGIERTGIERTGIERADIERAEGQPGIELGQERVSPESGQSYLDRVMGQISEFRLDNGIHFIVLERHQAPVISLMTYADVGGVDEPEGKTGVAHFLEHLAFKGTQRIGTRSYESEKPLLDQLDGIAQQITEAQGRGDQAQVEALQQQFTELQSQASSYVQQNAYGRIVEQAGGVGLNATTSADATRYFYSFPSNKLELWMSLESERFLEPVFREFYEEKDVILEERRLRVENSPIGQMVEALLDKAFLTHPYRRPVIGYEQDLKGLTRPDVQSFFDTHYVPSQLTFAVVGDVKPDEVQRLATIYFGRYPSRPASDLTPPSESPQTESRSVTLELPSQPWYMEAYHVPALSHPDHAVYEIITDILSQGRTSRLYQTLVEQDKVALEVRGFTGFPADKYPNLMLFYGLTAPGRTVDDVAIALEAQIERLKTEPVTEAELTRVKHQARASLLRSLQSNSGMADALTEYAVKTGDWRNLFRDVEAIAAVTAADVQRVAQATFAPEQRTTGRLLSKLTP